MLRRGLLTASVALIGGAITGGLGWLGGLFVRSSSQWPVRSAKKWSALCRLTELDGGKPLEKSFEFVRLEGWYRERVQRLVYVVKDERGLPVVLSRTCTHLGCSVRWRDADRQFHCPCHGGVFDERGRVTAGPPPRPLDPLECRVAGEMVEVAEA